MENIIISKEFLDWYDYYNECKEKYSSLVNEVEDKLIRGKYKDIELPFSNMNTANLNRDISSLEKIRVLLMQGSTSQLEVEVELVKEKMLESFLNVNFGILCNPLASTLYRMILDSSIVKKHVETITKQCKENDFYTSTFIPVYLRHFYASICEECITPKTKMIGLCNPHNPYGLVYTKEELDYIMTLCEKYNIYIMNDEIWSDIVYPDAKFESIYSLGNDRCNRVLSVFGYSKSFGLAGLRIGCVYTSDDKAFEKIIEASDVMSTAGGATSVSQVAAISAMNDARDWVKEFMHHLTENRNYAVDFINKNIPQLHAYKPQATYLLYVDIQDLHCTGVELVEFLKREVNLSVVPGGHNYFGDQSEGHIRICIATSKEILHEGLNRLKAGVEKFVGEGK